MLIALAEAAWLLLTMTRRLFFFLLLITFIDFHLLLPREFTLRRRRRLQPKLKLKMENKKRSCLGCRRALSALFVFFFFFLSFTFSFRPLSLRLLFALLVDTTTLFHSLSGNKQVSVSQ